MGNRALCNSDLLDLAHWYAQKHSGCTKVSVGSVITDYEGNILSMGANVSVPNLCKTRGCLRIEKYGSNAKEHRLPSDCRAVHSEIDAIAHLNQSGKGCTIYVTRYPCEACARAIVAAGIECVVYGRDQLPSEETCKILSSANVRLHHVDWTAEDNYN